MRLFHQVLCDLRRSHDDELTPLSVVLEELLGGARGSLPDLAARFAEAGMAPVMHSWVGDGPNLPISTKDLRRIVGEERVQDLSTLAGMRSGEFLVRLARLLPAAVHRMTPDGRLEASSAAC